MILMMISNNTLEKNSREVHLAMESFIFHTKSYFSPDVYGQFGKRLDKKAKIKFNKSKIYDVISLETNNYNTHNDDDDRK